MAVMLLTGKPHLEQDQIGEEGLIRPAIIPG